MKKELLKRLQGFTLIELLATITIMAIIGALLFPIIGNYTVQAQRNANKRSMQMLQDSINRFIALNTNNTLLWLTNTTAELDTNDCTNMMDYLTNGSNATLVGKSPALIGGATNTANFRAARTNGQVYIILYRGDVSGTAVAYKTTNDIATNAFTNALATYFP